MELFVMMAVVFVVTTIWTAIYFRGFSFGGNVDSDTLVWLIGFLFIWLILPFIVALILGVR